MQLFHTVKDLSATVLEDDCLIMKIQLAAIHIQFSLMSTLIYGHIIQTTFTLCSDSYLCRIRAEVRIRVRVGLMFSSDLSDPDFCTSQSRSRVGFDLKFRLCLVHDRVSLVLQ